MARIKGVDIPNNKRIEISLTYIYGIGRKSRVAIENAREKVAKAINACTKEIYFTSCGSESDNLALKGICYANKERGASRFISLLEHFGLELLLLLLMI